MLDVGFQELIIIFIVALIVFGPKKLPEIGRTLGKGIAELRRALEGVKDTIQAEETELRRGLDATTPSGEKPIAGPGDTAPPPEGEPTVYDDAQADRGKPEGNGTEHEEHGETSSDKDSRDG